MAQFQLEVQVHLHPALLDVQGRAVESALHAQGYKTVSDVRIGKHITMSIEAGSESEAREIAEKFSRDILSNPVMEGFKVSLESAVAKSRA